MDIANNEDEVNPFATMLESVLLIDEDVTPSSFNAALDKSLEKEDSKNPLLLRPVIRCVLKFLNIKDIKTCRLVCLEWGSTGKLILASRAVIRFSFTIHGAGRGPAEFRSCFQNSATPFSAFVISGDFIPGGIKELRNFFGEQQKYVKELTLNCGYSANKFVKNIDIGSWISKSPMVMVQKDVEHLTKLSLENCGSGSTFVVPALHLIAHIRDLTLSNCRINLEAGIQICPIKLKLSNTACFQVGVKLDQVRINDFVDLNKAKDVFLQGGAFTKYVLDMSGHTALENLTLEDVEILNGETSQWEIKHLSMTMPYSLNCQMNIKELSLSHAGPIDLFTLPNSIQKLALYVMDGAPTTVNCSLPIVLENLEYLHILGACGNRQLRFPRTDCSFLSHFMDCPQLKHLKLNRCNLTYMKSCFMPQSVKTLTLDYSYWLVDNIELNLEKIILYGRGTFDKHLCKAKIKVDDIVVYFWNWDMEADKHLADFLEYRKRYSFGKRLYVGNFIWGAGKLEDSMLNEYVDSKSLFYVFENEEKGRAFSETEFHDLIPKHLEILI